MKYLCIKNWGYYKAGAVYDLTELINKLSIYRLQYYPNYKHDHLSPQEVQENFREIKTE